MVRAYARCCHWQNGRLQPVLSESTGTYPAGPAVSGPECTGPSWEPVTWDVLHLSVPR